MSYSLVFYRFSKYNDIVIQHLYHTAIHEKELLPFLGGDAYPAAFQGADKWRVHVQHLERTVGTRKLCGIHLTGKYFFVWCDYL